MSSFSHGSWALFTNNLIGSQTEKTFDDVSLLQTEAEHRKAFPAIKVCTVAERAQRRLTSAPENDGWVFVEQCWKDFLALVLQFKGLLHFVEGLTVLTFKIWCADTDTSCRINNYEMCFGAFMALCALTDERLLGFGLTRGLSNYNFLSNILPT